jgi:hypothetical protein
VRWGGEGETREGREGLWEREDEVEGEMEMERIGEENSRGEEREGGRAGRGEAGRRRWRRRVERGSG